MKPAQPPLDITHTSEEYFARLEEVRLGCIFTILSARPTLVTDLLRNHGISELCHVNYCKLVYQVERIRLLDMLVSLESGAVLDSALAYSMRISYPDHRRLKLSIEDSVFVRNDLLTRVAAIAELGTTQLFIMIDHQ